ncbi:MAG: o-succinylbenzoate synthase [Pseudarcicella sp.]|nr:o-succinylbenzoate synthase [Pseudarcicella sp.]
MSLRATFQKYTLHFRFEAGTSRGVLTEKETYFLKIFNAQDPSVFGLGECSILKGLSFDDVEDYEQKLQSVCDLFNELDLEVFSWNIPIILEQIIDKKLPSVVFGFETALLDYLNAGKRIVYDNSFSKSQSTIAINGLVWMGEKDFMLKQINDKLKEGYTCLKLKIGGIDFEAECSLLEHIREQFAAKDLTLRLDANGAFDESNVYQKLEQLANFEIHSIEQPIKPNQHDLLKQVIEKSPIPIALDEELIIPRDYTQKMQMLKQLMPPFIVLKPSLLGGFTQTKEWIEIASRLGINWWVTSALESNVGLNAIAQFCGEFDTKLPQGLGTGQLYHNNIPSPLKINNGFIMSDLALKWDLSTIGFH